MQGIFLAALLFLGSSYAFSQVIDDKSEEFREYFVERFLNQSSTSDDTWDMTMCIQQNPSGGCVERAGYKIKGYARGTVSELVKVYGRGVLLEEDLDPWTNVKSPYLRMEQSFVFRYDSTTTGKKQCYPGNFFCNYEWSELHPQGKIIVEIIANKPSGFNIKIRYEVMPGHDDRPNRLVAQAMRGLSTKAKLIVESYADRYAVVAPIILLD